MTGSPSDSRVSMRSFRFALALVIALSALIGLVMVQRSDALTPSPDSRLLGTWKSSGHVPDMPYLVLSEDPTTGRLRVGAYANCAHPQDCPLGYALATTYSSANQATGARTFMANIGLPLANLIVIGTLSTSTVVPFTSTLSVKQYITYFGGTYSNRVFSDTFTRSTTFGALAPAYAGSWSPGDSPRLASGAIGLWQNVTILTGTYARLRVSVTSTGATQVTPYLCEACSGVGTYTALTFIPWGSSMPSSFVVPMQLSTGFTVLEASYSPTTGTLKVRLLVASSSESNYNRVFVETFKKV